MVKALGEVIKKVCPSVARMTASAAIMPLAPARLSMTTGLPRASESFWPIKRAAMSMLPPADCDTINLTD